MVLSLCRHRHLLTWDPLFVLKQLFAFSFAGSYMTVPDLVLCVPSSFGKHRVPVVATAGPPTMALVAPAAATLVVAVELVLPLCRHHQRGALSTSAGRCGTRNIDNGSASTNCPDSGSRTGIASVSPPPPADVGASGASGGSTRATNNRGSNLGAEGGVDSLGSSDQVRGHFALAIGACQSILTGVIEAYCLNNDPLGKDLDPICSTLVSKHSCGSCVFAWV